MNRLSSLSLRKACSKESDQSHSSNSVSGAIQSRNSWSAGQQPQVNSQIQSGSSLYDGSVDGKDTLSKRDHLELSIKSQLHGAYYGKEGEIGAG